MVYIQKMCGKMKTIVYVIKDIDTGYTYQYKDEEQWLDDMSNFKHCECSISSINEATLEELRLYNIL